MSRRVYCVECLNFVNALSTHAPGLLFQDARFASIVVPWLEGLLGTTDTLRESTVSSSTMGASLLSGLTGVNMSAFSRLTPGDAGMRYSRTVQHAAVACFVVCQNEMRRLQF